MLNNCFRFAPRDSVPGLIAKICKYLKDHPGWSEKELEEQIKQFIGNTGVESFNGRTGDVELNENDVNNLKIASAYFAEGVETIDKLDLVTLYNQGVRFVFTNWNSETSSYDLSFVLDYFSGSNNVVYYPMSTGSGGVNIVSVNGKTGIVELSLSDILGSSGAQVKLCTENEFTSTDLNTWNAYYKDGYRVVGVVNSDASAIDHIYLLKHDENNHQPIGLSAGASDAYTPSNPPPYPVKSVNGKTGVVTGLYDAENPPPYPVSRVLGSVGDINDFKAFSVSFNSDRSIGNPFIEARRVDGNVRLHFESDKISSEYASSPNEYYKIYDERNQPPYPVKSVNGKTGVVTGLYDAENPPPYPVTSVNGKTGNVTVLDAPKHYQFGSGLVIEKGLSVIYGLPILTGGSLSKGSSVARRIRVTGLEYQYGLISLGVTVSNPYVQASITLEEDGFIVTVTSESPDGNLSSIHCNAFVDATSQCTISGIEDV